MAAIKARDTKPELLIRTGLHARGFRYRLQVRKLPGCPDLVFPKYQAVLFINGCFWHGHNCHLFVWPKTRPEFWKNKIYGNINRDQKNDAKLAALGWRTAKVWECALRGPKKLDKTLVINLVSDWLVGGADGLSIQGTV